MTRMVRALRGVLLASLVVSTILIGAVSAHEMSQADAAMTSAGAMQATAASGHAVGHDHGVAVGAETECDGTCDLGHSMVTVLCVVAAVAMLLLVAMPARRAMLWMSMSSGRVPRPQRAPRWIASTPSLEQLSICRT